MRLPEAKHAKTTWESASMTANKVWGNRAKITPAEITGPLVKALLYEYKAAYARMTWAGCRVLKTRL